MTLDQEKSSSQVTVLVVTEDNTDKEADSLTCFLLGHGMTVLRAYNGAEGLETVRMHPVDVILLDVKIPGMDVSAVFAALQQISPRLPIILVNEDDMATRAARARTAGVRFMNASADNSVRISDYAKLLARIQGRLSARRLEQEADRTSAAIEPTKPPTILVVDDDQNTVDILTRLLTRHGMTVLPAYNGLECLEIVRTHTVDVILLDDIMPGMDGFAVCAALKRMTHTPSIVFMTARDDMTTRAAALSLGVSEFIAKPINHGDLLARIHTQIAARR